MKTNLVKAFVALFVGVLMVGCGVPTEKDYKDACKDKDWDKAYSIVDEYREAAQPHIDEYMRHMINTQKKECSQAVALLDKYLTGLHYVILQECVDVIEQGDQSALIRIPMIIKEHRHSASSLSSFIDDAVKHHDLSYSDLPDFDIHAELLDIAKTTGDESLVSRLKTMFGEDE